MSLIVKNHPHQSKNSKKENITFNKFITDEIESLWSYYMTAFGYEEYYKETFKSFNGKTNTQVALKKLQIFFINNNIYDTPNYNLVTQSDQGNIILNNVKIWIMYIISIYNDCIELNEIMSAFENALQPNIDRIFLFEFFLIVISRLDSYRVAQLKEVDIPSAFRSIYFSNRKALLSLFESKKIFS
jgi:hypothetical protein